MFGCDIMQFFYDGYKGHASRFTVTMTYLILLITQGMLVQSTFLTYKTNVPYAGHVVTQLYGKKIEAIEKRFQQFIDKCNSESFVNAELNT